MAATLPATAALFFIYLLVLAAIFLAFRGTRRSVAVSLQRAEVAMEGGRTRAASGVGVRAEAALLLPPLDAALQTGGLGEGRRPGWEEDLEGGWEGEGEGQEEQDGEEEDAAGLAALYDPFPAPSRSSRSGGSLLNNLERAMDMPSVRRVPARERFELEAKRTQARGEAAAAAAAAASAPRRAPAGTRGTPRRDSAPAPVPRHFSPEARLMLPAAFAPPPSQEQQQQRGREAKTIYPSEDATYGAAEFDVVVSPQQGREARFSMTPEERILASHIHGGG